MHPVLPVTSQPEMEAPIGSSSPITLYTCSDAGEIKL